MTKQKQPVSGGMTVRTYSVLRRAVMGTVESHHRLAYDVQRNIGFQVEALLARKRFFGSQAPLILLALMACCSSPDTPSGDDGVPSPLLGTALHSNSARGSGACRNKTVQDAVSESRTLAPGLLDITQLYAPDPDRAGDGSFIYAFSLETGGFALVFRRGGGDCPAGCTENEYWYFQSDAACRMQVAGHYHPQWIREGANCLKEDGAPRWAMPPPPDPSFVCGADNSPQNISGTYEATASGKQVDCAAATKSEPRSITRNVTLTINQTADMLGSGTVVIGGTGNPGLDGVPLKAAFSRRRFEVEQTINNNASACQDQSKFSINVDLDNPTNGKLRFDEVRSISCPEPTNMIGYCKGYVDLNLVVRQ